MKRAAVEEVLEEYKRRRKEDILHLLPVYQEDILMGYLRPITFDYKISLPGIVPALSTWRRDTPYAWNSVFKVTDEGTEEWLEKFVLRNKNRIIFIVQDLDHHYIGQIGLAAFNENDKSAEIDAVVRGEKNKQPGIMSAALRTITVWGRRKFGLEHIYLDVFEDNVHAIEFYKRNNFIELERISLAEIKCETETKWEVDEKINPDSASRRYIKMKLET